MCFVLRSGGEESCDHSLVIATSLPCSGKRATINMGLSGNNRSLHVVELV